MAQPNTVAATVAERGKVYGAPLPSHRNIGLSWTGLLQQHYGIEFDHPIPPELVAQMMVVFKMQRAARVFHADNYVDGMAYMGFAEEWQGKGKRTPCAYCMDGESGGEGEEVITTWVKKCDCKSPSSTGQFRKGKERLRDGRIHVAYDFIPQPSCDECGLPWVNKRSSGECALQRGIDRFHSNFFLT